MWIFFDWNGTLLDDAYDSYGIFCELMKREGLETPSFSMYRQKMTFPLQDLYKNFGFDFQKISYKELTESFMNQYEKVLPQISLQTGVFNLLTELKASFSLGIISAFSENRLKNELKARKLDSFFSLVIGAPDDRAEKKIQKASKVIFEKKINPSKSILIGDTFHDYEVAQNIGFACVLLNCGYQDSSTFPKNVSILQKFADLSPQYLLNILKQFQQSGDS